MFVFGAKGNFYSSLEQIPESERNLVKICKVVCKNDDIPDREFITYMNDEWVSVHSSGPSVLNQVMYTSNIDTDKLLYYEGNIFYSKKLLFDYLIKQSKVEIIKFTPSIEFRLNSELSSEPTKYPTPPTDRSSLYEEEKARLDQELDDYHKLNGCDC